MSAGKGSAVSPRKTQPSKVRQSPTRASTAAKLAASTDKARVLHSGRPERRPPSRSSALAPTLALPRLRGRVRVGVALLAVVLAGCAVGPDFEPPVAPDGSGYMAPTLGAGTSAG